MKKSLALLLALSLLLGCLAGCKPGTGEESGSVLPQEESGEEKILRTEHYLYGLNYVEAQMSDRLSTAQVAYMAMALGAESVRICAYCLETATTFSEDARTRLHGLCQSLLYSGIDQVVVQQAMLPLEGVLGHYSPEPDLEDGEYLSFLDEVEAMAKLLGSEYSEVEYWQIGHHLNEDLYLHPMGWKEEKSPVPGYSVEEKAQITADICFRVTKGLREAGSRALVILPDFSDAASEEAAEYLDALYAEITGGERGSANVDDFFGALAWDFAFDENPGAGFTEACERLYGIAEKYGDEGRHAFISEIGFTAGTEEQDADASAWMRDVYAQAKALDYIESVQYYRLFTDGEERYGMICEPRAGFKPTATGRVFYELTGSAADLEKYVIKEDQYSSGDNVALNVPTYASSSCEHPGWGWSLAGINNGTLNYGGWSNYYEFGTEEWATILTGTGAPSPDYPEWVVFELPYVWEIDKVLLYARNEVDEVFHELYGLPRHIVVEVSDDGETWRQVGELRVEAQVYPDDVTEISRDENPPLEIAFEPVATKYVRVFFKELRTSWQHTEDAFFVQLEEIEIIMH